MCLDKSLFRFIRGDLAALDEVILVSVCVERVGDLELLSLPTRTVWRQHGIGHTGLLPVFRFLATVALQR